ncbi:MAG: MFS transporter, partial [Fibrobacter sp.]|nr:MFS transporter [Fibrobacter sp.]
MKIRKIEFCYAMMFMVLLVGFAASILGDSITETMLLAHFDADVVAQMFLVNAIFLFLASGPILSIIDRIDRGFLFKTTLLAHLSIIIIIRFLLYMGTEFLYPFFYSYAYISKIIFFLLFWVLANDLVDSRKAATLFPRLAAGGTIGAITISFLVPWLMTFFEVQDLFYVWGALVFCVYLLFIPVKRNVGIHFKVNRDRIGFPVKSIRSLLGDLKLLKNEPMLKHVSILYGLVFFLLIVQQYYFYSQIQNSLHGEEQVISFLGYFNGTSMIMTLILQLVLAGNLIKRFGSTRTMLVLPVIFGLNYAAMFFVSGGISGAVFSLFQIIVIGKGLRLAFFDSFFTPNLQIFFSSLPQEIRGRGKVLVDGVVKPFAIIVAGVWLITVSSKIPETVNYLVLSIVSVIAVIEAWRLKSKYAQSLIMYFTGNNKKESAVLSKRLKIRARTNFHEMINEKLKNEDFIVKRFIIEFLADSATDEAVTILTDNLKNSDPKVRATVLAALGKLKIENVKGCIIACLSDADNRVIANAIIALSHYKNLSLKGYIEPFLYHSNRRVCTDAMIALWPLLDENRQEHLLNELECELNDRTSTPLRISSNLYLLGEIDDKRTLKILDRFHLSNKNDYENQMVFDQMVNAVSKKNSRQSLKILLEIASVSSSKRKLTIKRKIISLFEIIDFCDIVNCLNEKNCVGRNLMFHAIFDMPEEFHEKIRPQLQHIASEEINFLKSNMDVFDKVSGYRGTELFCCALMEEYIENDLETLTIIA